MFQFRLPSLPSLWSSSSGAIKIKKAEVYNIEESPEKRARALKHLIKHNHITHSIIYNDLRFHNHTPHILGSSYIFGAQTDLLAEIYEAEGKHLEPWKDSPGEIALHDWRDYLGKREYQRAFVDFFEDQLVKHGYDWRELLKELLLEGKDPLVNNLISGLGHPLIHLGYAFELDSRTIAMEAMALTACFYNDWHVYLDDPQYTKPAPNPSDSLFTLLDRIGHEKAFDGLFDHKGSDNITTLLSNKQAAEKALEYWNSWHVEDAVSQFAESQKLAVALLVASEPRDGSNKDKSDFFLVHLLNTSHAVRVLLPVLPAKFHLPLIRQWWLFTELVYIAQLRPKINIDNIKLVDLDDKDWKYISKVATEGKYRTDAHFVKALRSMHEASKTWGDPQQYYLKAAVKLTEEFEGWGGFGPRDAETGAGSDGKPSQTRRYSGQGAVNV
ncbi:hypothetical protein K431DRAFT_275377 [Polychaeton citri CBS 116435]|uniref:Apoptosis regulator Bcl-2 family BH4 domain-containing protein n=1 Tax=Polychaeton citri CBS 116435 TaxID=1314669 RepID=A0A9P4Q284_9PEZI|nr:hypothetical protein K431DRAFT_275377 [Polychaeton citri CBS 116435]